jgi:type IV fimbrial biogenesis protein FimT
MNGRAFSLLELVLVTLIMALLASVALPSYAGFTAQQQLEGAARRIVSDLAYAQRQARQSSRGQTVEFDVANNSYALKDLNDLNHKARPFEVCVWDEPYRARIVSASFGGDPELVYDGFGMPDSGGSVTLAVGSYQKTISLSGGVAKAKGNKPIHVEQQ